MVAVSHVGGETKVSGRIPTEAELRTRAHSDAMSAIARSTPDPETYARYLPLAFAEAILGATLYSPGGANLGGGYRVSLEQGAMLAPYGLVEAGEGGRYLTAFCMAVRRALIAEDA